MARGRRYSEEFKLESVRPYWESGLGHPPIYEDFGLSACALRQ